MKRRIAIFLFILISLLNVNAFSASRSCENSFETVEDIFMSKTDFVENGVKIQYKTTDDVISEKNRIKQLLNQAGINIFFNGNSCRTKEKSFETNINIWSDDSYTYGSIEILNHDSQYHNFDLRNFIKKVENKNLKDIQYFDFYRGKVECRDINQLRKIGMNIIDEADINNVNLLDIENGYVGSGCLKNGVKIDFSMNEYDTGFYIIIGTPVIFTTY